MPTKSQAQRGYLFAKFGAAWVKKHHFDNKGSLPEHASKQRAAKALAKGRRRERQHSATGE